MNYLYVFIEEKNENVYKPESYFMGNSMEFLSQTVKNEKENYRIIKSNITEFLVFSQVF